MHKQKIAANFSGKKLVSPDKCCIFGLKVLAYFELKFCQCELRQQVIQHWTVNKNGSMWDNYFACCFFAYRFRKLYSVVIKTGLKQSQTTTNNQQTTTNDHEPPINDPIRPQTTSKWPKMTTNYRQMTTSHQQTTTNHQL